MYATIKIKLRLEKRFCLPPNPDPVYRVALQKHRASPRAYLLWLPSVLVLLLLLFIQTSQKRNN